MVAGLELSRMTLYPSALRFDTGVRHENENEESEKGLRQQAEGQILCPSPPLTSIWPAWRKMACQTPSKRPLTPGLLESLARLGPRVVELAGLLGAREARHGEHWPSRVWAPNILPKAPTPANPCPGRTCPITMGPAPKTSTLLMSVRLATRCTAVSQAVNGGLVVSAAGVVELAFSGADTEVTTRRVPLNGAGRLRPACGLARAGRGAREKPAPASRPHSGCAALGAVLIIECMDLHCEMRWDAAWGVVQGCKPRSSIGGLGAGGPRARLTW